MTLRQVPLPPFGVVTQALIVPIESTQELLTFQGVDGVVYDVDYSGLT